MGGRKNDDSGQEALPNSRFEQTAHAHACNGMGGWGDQPVKGNRKMEGKLDSDLVGLTASSRPASSCSRNGEILVPYPYYKLHYRES
jgi:hypothetical protein